MSSKIDKNAVKASFSKAAKHYDQHAELQRDVGYQLLALLKNECALSRHILDLGCGTGYFSKYLSHWQHMYKVDKSSSLTCLDLSPVMLEQTKLRKINNCTIVEGDIDKLPFTKQSFDVVFSNLALQWSENLSSSLTQIKETLNEHGVVFFSTLLDGSLQELKTAFQSVDQKQHINSFLSETSVEEALNKAGFKRVKIINKVFVSRYPDLKSVMQSLKGIGANHVHNGKSNGLSTRLKLEKVNQGYQPFKDKLGLYKLSYKVCFVVAFNE